MRLRTPIRLQMEAAECGAASLGIILAYYHKHIPLEELRVLCNVSRDGSNALNIVKAARHYSLEAKGLRRPSLEALQKESLPSILHWGFNHFLVLEGIGKQHVYLNDPAVGRRRVSLKEFNLAYTGVVLTFKPTANFQKGGQAFQIWHAFGELLKGSGSAILYLLWASSLLLIANLALPLFLQLFVDRVLIQQLDWHGILLAGLGISLLLAGILTQLQQATLLKLERKLSNSLSARCLWNLLHLPIDFFNQRYTGDLVHRIQLNDHVAHLLSGELATSIIMSLLIGTYLVLMAFYDMSLTLMSLAMALLNIGALQGLMGIKRDASIRLSQERGHLLGNSLNTLHIIETVKATGAESEFFKRWGQFHAKMLNVQYQLSYWSQLLQLVPTFLLTLSSALLLWIGSSKVLEGELSLGMLLAFNSLMLSFMRPIQQLLLLASRLQEATGDLSRIEDILNYPPIENPPVLPLPEKRLTGLLEVKHLSFGFNRLEAPIIEDFNLTIYPGQRVALVGTTGSGKSTLARLVAGFYPLWQGEILLDSYSLNQIQPVLRSRSVAMVDQSIWLFEGTVQDNLSLWDNEIPQSQLIEACKDAQIHQVIATRPSNYQSPVEEDGHNFSGGERQRLEIARALLHNPCLLLLDEATSALDAITERQIDENLRRRGCTCLIVSHRLSTIKDADEIIVMDKGKIVERGKHADLVKQKGLYAELIGADELKSDSNNLIDNLLDQLL